MVVAAITMMLEYVGAAKLLGPQVCHHPLSADPQPIVQQHLLYMGWHRREPEQPLNHVFVSSATSETESPDHKLSYTGRLDTVSGGVPRKEKSLLHCHAPRS